MFKSKLEKFIAKRVLFTFVLLTIYDLAFIGAKWTALTGLIIGGVLSIIKLGSYTMVFQGIVTVATKSPGKSKGIIRSLVIFIINQIVLLPMLLIAIKINYWLFIGFVAGILLVPFIMFINCFTEGLRITHNNFE